MTRRDWLTRVFGATVAAAIAPLVDLTDATPAFWNQVPIKDKLRQWRVVFPSGDVFTFDAEVVGEKLIGDEVQLDIKPVGPITVIHQASLAEDVEPPDPPSATVLVSSDGKRIELTDIELPPVEYAEDDIDNYVVGLKRTGAVTFTGRWE